MTTTTQHDAPMGFAGWQAAFNALPDATFILDGDRVLRANQRAVEVTGHPLEDLGGMALSSFIDQPQAERSLLHHRQGNATPVAVTTSEFADGARTLTVAIVKPTDELPDGVAAFKYLKATFEDAPEAVFLASADGFMYRNRAAAVLTAYSPDELDGIRLSGLVSDPQLSDHIVSGFSPVAVPPSESHYAALRRKDGVLVPVVITIHSANIGSVTFQIGTVVDLRSAREVERALSESNRLLNAMFAQPLAAMAVTDPNLRFVDANEAMSSLTGYSRGELLRMTPTQLHDNEQLATALARLVVPGASSEILLMDVVRRDGSRLPCEFHLSGFPVAGEWRLFMLGFDTHERVNAERSLVDSERRFRSMFENVPMGLVFKDENNLATNVNPAMCKLFQREESDLVGHALAEFLLTGSPRQELMRHDRLVRSDLDQYWFERPYVRPDGSSFWASGFNAAVRDSSGQFLYSVEAIQDVNERVEREESLRLTEQRYAALSSQMQSILESAGEGIYVSDLAGNTILSNRNALEISGRALQEATGRSASEWIGGLSALDGSPYQLPTAQEVILSGRPVETPPLTLERRDGSNIVTEITIAPVLATDGSPQGIVGIVRDVTARIRAEKVLEATAQRFRTLFERSPIGIAVVNSRREMQEANEAMRTISGLDDSALLGHRIPTTTGGNTGTKQFDELVRGEIETYHSERQIIGGDGALRRGRFTTFSVRDEQSKFLYAFRLLEDVTKQREAERQISQNAVFLQTLVDRLPMGVFLHDQNQRFTLANETAASMTGFSKHALLSMYLWDLIPDEEEVIALTKAQLPIPDDYPDSDYELMISRKDGSSFPANLPTRNLTAAYPGHRLGIWRDLSQQRNSERILAQQIAEGAESEERERLARDIHDTVVQDLTGIVLQLEVARRLLASSSKGLEAQLDSAQEFARQALSNTRRSVWDLSTTTLAQGELPIALRNEVEGVLSGQRIAVTLENVGEAHPLSSRVEATLLRIAHEAATNVAKHANASELTVSLTYQTDGVSLWIIDNGRGLTASRKANRGRPEAGFGMKSMEERARLIGAAIQFTEGPTGGTIVAISVPSDNRG